MSSTLLYDLTAVDRDSGVETLPSFLPAPPAYHWEEFLMISEGTEAQLYLDGQLAGMVRARHGNHSWGFGDFTPTPHFGNFAILFGRWSLLMHADGEKEPLSPAASEELRETEIAIDALKAKLFVPEGREWHSLSQLNIDGPMIEWKEA